MTDAMPETLCFTTAADGSRRIAFSELGDPNGLPVIYAHGFPSSRREALLIAGAAAAAGARIITIDRPGYGDSDPAPARMLTDWPDDVAAVADALGIARFALLGISGGGPYALACAWRAATAHPERLTACTLACPLGPIYHKALLDQMNWAARMNLSLGRRSEQLTDIVFGAPTTAALQRWPALVERMRSFAAPPADREVLADSETTEILNRTIADAMRDGALGAKRDLHLYTHDWQLPFGQIRFPVRIYHGQADGTVPIDHARWYAEHLPQARLTELPGEGHYSVPLRYSRQILDELIATAVARGPA